MVDNGFVSAGTEAQGGYLNEYFIALFRGISAAGSLHFRPLLGGDLVG